MTAANADYGAGDRVVFTYYHGESVEGVVTSTNDRYVFVRFSSGYSEACDPSMLRPKNVRLNDGKDTT